jgi:hypothetical protein
MQGVNFYGAQFPSINDNFLLLEQWINPVLLLFDYIVGDDAAGMGREGKFTRIFLSK